MAPCIPVVMMVEFHVDDHHSFQDKMNSTTRFGGNPSIQKPIDKKNIICFGQDEAIMKQCCFTTKAWTAPSGQKAIVPKDEGMCTDACAVTSHAFTHLADSLMSEFRSDACQSL
jgi:hypothetical protein